MYIFCLFLHGSIQLSENCRVQFSDVNLASVVSENKLHINKCQIHVSKLFKCVNREGTKLEFKTSDVGASIVASWIR